MSRNLPDRVVLGAHNIRKKEKSQQIISISELIPHPKYQKELSRDNPESQEYDIMLLKVSSHETVDYYIQLNCREQV